MKFYRGPEHTHYDLLGVVPATIDVGKAFEDKVRALVPEKFAWFSGMRRLHQVEDVRYLCEAYAILGHGERRAEYNRELLAQGRICPLCSGWGKIKMDQLKEIDCAACKATGKASVHID